MKALSYWDLGIMPKKGDLMVAFRGHNEFPLTLGKVYQAATDAGDLTYWDCVFIIDDTGTLRSYTVEYFTPYNPEERNLIMDKKLPIDSINEIAHLLPRTVLEDINKRMVEWKVSGGEDDDPYMYQQLRYARHVLQNLQGVR